MKRLSLTLLFSLSIFAADPKDLARKALDGDVNAVVALRAMGQPAVDALLAVRPKVDTPRFHAVIDYVCKQRDCAWSGLYWYTDLSAAQRMARQTKRPILSLRLLGNLDEELSCANSRYFRTLLYSNREISAFLRRNYILHWQQERPAPVITIDFGNGQRMRRTITGNSIHYVLDADGKPLDAIPGLYSPPAFLALIREGATIHRVLQLTPPYDRDGALRIYHMRAETNGKRTSAEFSPFRTANEIGDTRDRRVAAWMITPSKSGGEAPLLDRVSLDARAIGLMSELQAKLRRTLVDQTTIDENARSLIRAKRAAVPVASLRSDASMKRMLKNLEQTLAADTAINEGRLRPLIHEELGKGVHSLETLNAWVYSHLFHAPAEDRWMGLVAGNYFTGISGEGLIMPSN